MKIELTPEDDDRIKAALEKPIEEREKPKLVPKPDPKALPCWNIKPVVGKPKRKR